MKNLVLKKGTLLRILLVVSGIVLVPVKLSAGEVSWVKRHSLIYDWYYMYDDNEPRHPFSAPLLMPLDDVAYRDVHNYGTKIDPQDDTPHAYPLPDSFWYFGCWYGPGDTLYISPDGWVSFDGTPPPEDTSSGYPYPPEVPPFPSSDPPNALIAPLWQDNDPTLVAGDADNNRVYYHYDELGDNTLAVEWYQVVGDASGETYTYEVILHLGGQDKLVISGACGIMFSYHLIECLYHSSTDWNGDNGEAGFEDQTGDFGIWYEGTIANGRKTRAGYKRVFRNDMAPAAVISPGEMVLRHTDVEPQVVVVNMGEETEHFQVMLEIYDEADNLVYDFSTAGFGMISGERDTLVAPCWIPGEIGQTYTMYVFTQLERDSCRHNDTLVHEIYVGCEDTLRYPWNEGDWQGRQVTSSQHLITSYSVADGALITGGRVWVMNDDDPGDIVFEVFSADAGCGATSVANLVASEDIPSGWSGWHHAEFPGSGVWVSSNNPGNIWAGVSSAVAPSVYFGEYGMRDWPADVCYAGTGPGRGGYLSPSFSWGGKSANFYTPRIELFAHLGFGDYPLPPQPFPPCYNGKPRDVACSEIVNPDYDYVEATVAFIPEVEVVNIGRQAESDFPTTFIVIDEETGDTVYNDSSTAGDIGWLGNPGDDPDTVYVITSPWTPEGFCHADEPFRHYEITSLVRLGEVGPDESDHCPYNDTVIRSITSRWSHDVGVEDIYFSPDFDQPPDIFNPGTEVTVYAVVENYGYNEEFDIPVTCAIIDQDADPDTVVFQDQVTVPFIDKRYGPMAGPPAEVMFGPWIVPNDNRFMVECRTQYETDQCTDDDPCYRIINSGIEEEADLPGEFSLDITMASMNAPARIRFAVPVLIPVLLTVYGVNGRLLKTLHDDVIPPGYHELAWNGNDNFGRKVAAGIYLVRMEAGEFEAVRKVVILN